MIWSGGGLVIKKIKFAIKWPNVNWHNIFVSNLSSSDAAADFYIQFQVAEHKHIYVKAYLIYENA